jgi:hypothetical protein
MSQLHSANPFLSNLTNFEARAAFGLERAPRSSSGDDGPVGYALVQSGPAPLPEECENLAARAVEINVLWGTSIIHVAHLQPARSFTIGEASCDVTLPSEKTGASRLEIVSLVAGEPCVTVPAGATARTIDSSGSHPVAAGGIVQLALGTRVEIRFGDIIVQVAGVTAGKRTQRAYFASDDHAAASYFGLSAAVVAAFVGAMAFFVPAMGVTEDETSDAERVYMVQQYLAANAERNRELTEQDQGATDAQQGGGEKSAGAKGESGAMGKLGAKVTDKRAGVAGPKDNPEPHMARERALNEARNFGIIGLLDAGPGGDPNAPTVPWGRDSSLGTDDKSALGNMWGDDIGESGGFGGLGLTGIGEGGGMRGETIGLTGIGTCGSSLCSGVEGGFGRSLARTGPQHTSSVPQVRIGVGTSVSGHLPGEVIQRIVRQNYGRFRMCYEQGLSRNPNLEGRVAVRFVIGRDGSVSNVGNGGSDLPDSGVVSCVMGAYYGLSFPAPEDGIVTVTYPIQFQPG